MQKVIKTCRLIGHRLPKRSFDHGHDGSFYACHAEKQLIPFSLSKHCFFCDEITDPKDGSIGDLNHVQPPVSLRRSTILVGTAVCKDCSAFARKVEHVFGLVLRLENCEGNIRA